MANANTLPPVRRAPPAPGMKNEYVNPYPYNTWHQVVRVDENTWCLINHPWTVATVGDAQTIAEALTHMPIADSLYDLELLTPRQPTASLVSKDELASIISELL